MSPLLSIKFLCSRQNGFELCSVALVYFLKNMLVGCLFFRNYLIFLEFTYNVEVPVSSKFQETSLRMQMLNQNHDLLARRAGRPFSPQ